MAFIFLIKLIFVVQCFATFAASPIKSVVRTFYNLECIIV